MSQCLVSAFFLPLNHSSLSKEKVIILKADALLVGRFVKLDAPHQGLSPGGVSVGASFFILKKGPSL